MREDNPNSAMTAKSDTVTAGREKTWEECGIEERLERLRREFRAQREFNEHIATNHGSTLGKLERHSHAADGSVVVPLHSGGGGMLAGSCHDPLR